MSPADAKRMPSRVRVHLVTLDGIEIKSWLEQAGAEGDHLFVRGSRVVGVEVEMHLLGSPMRPVGRDVVRRQLHADPPLSSGVDDAVPIVFLEDVPAEDASPERALGMKVGRVEHYYLTHYVHDAYITGATAERTISLGLGALSSLVSIAVRRRPSLVAAIVTHTLHASLDARATSSVVWIRCSPPLVPPISLQPFLRLTWFALVRI